MWTFFQAIRRSWSQHFVTQATGLVVMTLTLTGVFFVAMVLENVQSLFDHWGQVQNMTIYLQPKAKVQEKNQLTVFLQKQDMVESINLISSNQLAHKFSKKFSKYSSHQIDEQKLSDYFPESLKLTLNHERAYKSQFGELDAFVLNLTRNYAFIKDISYGKSWLYRYKKLLSLFHIIGYTIIAVFILGSLLISSSVIKSILFNKKDEIEILEFVGADDLSICLPHVLNAVLITCAALFLSMGLNYIIYTGFQQARLFSLGGSLTYLSLGKTVFLSGLCLSVIAFYSFSTVFNLLPHRQSLHAKRYS